MATRPPPIVLAVEAAASHAEPADRKILAGLVVILFAGFSGLTVAMWRDLGRRVGE